MSGEQDSVITVEQYEELKSGLKKVEKMLNETAFAKMEEKIEGLESVIEKQRLQIDELSKAEPAVVEPAVVEPAVVEPAVVEPAVVEPAVVEPDFEKMKGAVESAIKECLDPLEERLKKIEETPVMKGVKDSDGDLGKPVAAEPAQEEGMVLEKILKDAFEKRARGGGQ